MSGGLEASPDWTYLGPQIVARRVRVRGRVGPGLRCRRRSRRSSEFRAWSNGSGLVASGPERYGTLGHPGDRFAFDMFTPDRPGPAGPARPGVRSDALRPERIIAMGESQSAFFLTTYINAVQPIGAVPTTGSSCTVGAAAVHR